MKMINPNAKEDMEFLQEVLKKYDLDNADE